MLSINPELTLPVPEQYEKESLSLHMFGIDEIILTHSDKGEMPMEDFKYVAIDTQKFDAQWQSNTTYLPDNAKDFVFDDKFSYLSNRSHAMWKLFDKIELLTKALEDSKKLYSPVIGLDEGVFSFMQGRHRFWSIKHAGIPFFVASIAIKDLNTLRQTNLILAESEAIFDGDRTPSWFNDY